MADRWVWVDHEKSLARSAVRLAVPDPHWLVDWLRVDGGPVLGRQLHGHLSHLEDSRQRQTESPNLDQRENRNHRRPDRLFPKGIGRTGKAQATRPGQELGRQRGRKTTCADL